jgi:hypothetical protein
MTFSKWGLQDIFVIDAATPRPERLPIWKLGAGFGRY